MKAKELIELLKQVPEESEVNISVGCEFQGDMFQRTIGYTAAVVYQNVGDNKVFSLSISELDAHEYIEKDTETRTIEWCGEKAEIDLYRIYHRYEHQYQDGGFPLDPILRKSFDMTPNEARDPLEVNDWWGKPFISTNKYSSPDASYSEYVERMSRYSFDGFKLGTEEEFNQRIAKGKEEWLAAWPTGTRYEVRCLDGGAWDRSSSKGMFSSLELAVYVCNKIESTNGFLSCMREEDVIKEFEAQAQ